MSVNKCGLRINSAIDNWSFFLLSANGVGLCDTNYTTEHFWQLYPNTP